ncbi:DNA-binding GntR family transcriptional regulator [Paenibacillus sp. BK033]|uniref:GntR family transcriptional regulator n=1 Tax=Paenibacillus sp. BK033 TaxID=2512133 RepID=UPI00104ADF68|nr:GntR family transcriptional regulator [Paenibacillus sp. BK033]TCM96988.1 DNA-binding GntR family transcriptional regulator [Paenibacillus sp. BK033]
MSSTSLETIAYREIRERIMRAEYMPGSMLSENELAALLGMSRTPVRAAVSLLEREGLVGSFRGRGVMVKEVSVHEFSEMYEVLVSMQLFVLDAAAKRQLKFDIATMEQLLEQQQSALEQKDYYGYYNSNLQFTETILGTIHNESMLQIIELYRGRYVFTTVSYRIKYPQYQPSRSIQTNRGILEALKRGDIAVAKAAVASQYSDTHEQFILHGLMK